MIRHTSLLLNARLKVHCPDTLSVADASADDGHIYKRQIVLA